MPFDIVGLLGSDMEPWIAGPLAGLFATAVMTILEVPAWRRRGFAGILDWEQNQTMAARLIGRPAEELVVAGLGLHFWHRALGPDPRGPCAGDRTTDSWRLRADGGRDGQLRQPSGVRHRTRGARPPTLKGLGHVDQASRCPEEGTQASTAGTTNSSSVRADR